MPAIYIFQRRTWLGGDDLQLPAASTIFVRIIQLIVLVVPLLYSVSVHAKDAGGWIDYLLMDPSSSNECRDSHLFPLMVVVSLASFASVFSIASIWVESKIYSWSSHGCPTDYKDRSQQIERWLEIKLLVVNVLLIMIILSSVVACVFAKPYVQCQRHLLVSSGDDIYVDEDDDDKTIYIKPAFFSKLWWFSFSFLLLTQLFEALLGLAFIVSIIKNAPQQRPPSPPTLTSPSSTTAPPIILSNSQLLQYQQHELTEQMWAERCQRLCYCLSVSTCFIFGGHEIVHLASTPSSSSTVAYRDVARALADYMETRGVLDVVPTDLVAGLVVLQRVQRQRRLQARLEVRESETLERSRSRRNVLFLQHHQKHQHEQHKQSSNNSLSTSTISTATTSSLSSTTPTAATPAPSTAPLPSPTIESPSTAPYSPIDLRSPTTAAVASSSASSIRPSNTPLLRKSRSTDLIQLSSSNSSTSTTSLLATIEKEENGITLESNDTQSTPDYLTHNNETATATATANQNNRLILRAGGTNMVVPTTETSIYRRATIASGSSHQRDMRQPRQRNQNRRPYYQRHQREVLISENPSHVKVIEDGAKYARYALAIYTWILYLYVHPVSGIPKLLSSFLLTCTKQFRQPPQITDGNSDDNQRNNSNNSNISAGNILHDAEAGDSGWNIPHSSSSNNNDNIIGDNWLQAHKRSLLLFAGIKNEADLIYAQFRSGFSVIPYCIILDHEAQSVVLSIRGTLSLEDCVTDVLVDPEPLVELGREYGLEDVFEGQYCHGGVVACVRNLLRDLRVHGWLEQLLLGDGPRTSYPHYKLQLVGHSLGAATATVVSFILRKTFPNLQVWNFSPPGCVVTWDLATACHGWCRSFVLDSDLVPRLSRETIEVLRDEMLHLIGRIKIPKIQVAQRLMADRQGFFHACSSEHDNEQDIEYWVHVLSEVLYDEMPQNTDYARQLEQFRRIQMDRKRSRGAIREHKLYPPGKLIHLVKTSENRSCCSGVAKCLTCCTTNAGFNYTPVWIGNDDLNEIVVSPTMGTDHFPNRMCFELEELARQFST